MWNMWFFRQEPGHPNNSVDLTNQLKIHTSADITGIIGDDKGDSGTFRSSVSAATKQTKQSKQEKP